MQAHTSRTLIWGVVSQKFAEKECTYLFTLANCLSSFSPIVLVKISGYTRNILCYVWCTMKSSQLLQNMVLNADRVIWLVDDASNYED